MILAGSLPKAIDLGFQVLTILRLKCLARGGLKFLDHFGRKPISLATVRLQSLAQTRGQLPMTDPAEGQPGVSPVDPNRTGRRPRNREHYHYRSSEDTVIFTGANKAPSFEFSSGGEGRAQTPMRLRGSLRT